MLNQEQLNWLARLSDSDSVNIFPFDPSCSEKFEKIKQKIQSQLGEDLRVEHHGASSLGISGQDEIDVYVPVPTAEFDKTVLLVQTFFGEPKSVGSLKRARFATEIDGKKIDLFVVNEEHEEWKKHQKFKSFLLSHPKALEEYRMLKENAAGKSTREYYRAKLEFINGILELAE
jgi:GrpB-like predicted nucleotidyltransferase (UPF0157 family)